MSFDIREYLEFQNGRAYCPSCEKKKGRSPRQRSLALVPGTDGAYLCHAGCTVDEIRSAIGQPKVPVSSNGNGHKPTPNDQTYTALQVGKFVGLLLNGQTPDAIEAREWLSNRGIPSDLIAHYQLGLTSSPKGIGIPIPLPDGTYSIKTRRFPLDSSGIWHQKGIPALVFFTHQPEGSTQTWLCEGEWDALLLGWQVKEANLPITVATFTCGARSVPPESELRKLPGEVVILYDRDEAGAEGSQKVAQALQKVGKSARIAQVPCQQNPVPKGWDISDALQAGFTLTDLQWASSQSTAPTPNSDYHQAMQQMEGILAIEDPGQRLWQLAAFSKQTPFTPQLLHKIFTERQRTLTPFAPLDVQDVLATSIPDRQWLIASHLSLGSVVLLYADGGIGKSLLAYDLTKAVALGIPWNHFPTLQSRVLILQTDEPDIDTCERLRIARFEEIGRDKVFIERHWQFSQLNKLKQWVNDYQPRLIVIDSLTSCNRFSEIEEKDMAYALGLLDMVELASTHHCSVLVLHHENKLGGVRGSTAIRNAVSEVWHLKKPDQGNFSPLQRLLDIEKSRSGCNSISVIELDPEDNSWKHHGELGDPNSGKPPLSTQLLQHLQAHPGTCFEPDELVLEFPNTNRDQIRKALERWRKQGVLQAEERLKKNPTGANRYKVYRAPPEGTLSSVAQTQSEQAFQTLDTQLMTKTCVQRVEPTPSKDPATLDTKTVRSLKPGDICRYCGPPGAMAVTCRGRPLTILSISGDIASVTTDKWLHPHEIPIQHLRKRT